VPLRPLLAEGKVRATGVSNFMVEQPHEAARSRHRGAGGQPALLSDIVVNYLTG
jgi:diketogulonate reductase-like aldo/keto reductase